MKAIRYNFGLDRNTKYTGTIFMSLTSEEMKDKERLLRIVRSHTDKIYFISNVFAENV
jgi:hypothetical protein